MAYRHGRSGILEVVFGTRAWTKICDLPPAKLQMGRVDVKYLLRCIKGKGELPGSHRTC